MRNQDWERFGEEIKRSVQDAVDSGDFSRLNQTITDTVNGAANTFSDTMRNVGDAVNRNIRGAKGGYQSRGGQPRYGEAWYGEKNEQPDYGKNANGSGNTGGDTHTRGGYQYSGHPYSKNQRTMGRQMPALYKSRTPATVSGVLLCVTGYGLSVFNLLMVLFGVLAIVTEPVEATGGLVVLILFSVLSIVTMILAVAGTKKLSGVSRFRQYVKELGTREYCNVKELAARIGKSEKFIVKDLKKMIQKGWFRQGHLDEQGKCLIASDDAYQQYTELMQRTKQQQQDAAEKAAKATAEKEKEAQNKRQMDEERSRLSPEVREVLEAGEEYIRKIHTSNDAIPGEEISEKISRMELLVDKIFDRVEENPESVSDLHRLMNYYLPTTVKLLEAYEELDSQPIQGDNIRSSKAEIEKTLDTLNAAFEKLLDSMFQDTAWDVSSDISVLHTMLAQEGLTEDGLKKNNTK